MALHIEPGSSTRSGTGRVQNPYATPSNAQSSTTSSGSQVDAPKESAATLENRVLTFQSPSLYGIVQAIYQGADPRQQRALLSYLLQSQHYNADYTTAECERLGYPKPIATPQTKSGYFRTEYRRQLDLACPIIQKVFGHMGQKVPGKNKLGQTIKICSRFAPDVLQILFPESLFTLVEFSLDNFPPSDHQPANNGEGNDPNVFLITVPETDFGILWAGEWNAPKKGALAEIFGPGILSHLNQAGVFPDRLSFHAALIGCLEELGNYEACCTEIGIHSPEIQTDQTKTRVDNQEISKKGISTCLSPKQRWKNRILELNQLKQDPSSPEALYQQAILRWDERFFADHEEIGAFAATLLASQVVPWMTTQSGIVEWSKAYQNICEIVMMSLQAFPDATVGQNFVDTTLATLRPITPGAHYACGLFPYAMSATFAIFQQILRRTQVQEAPYVAAVGQTYFETLILVEKMDAENKITTGVFQSLAEIDGAPHVLIADIHPNNAAKEKLFQNDVVTWVKNHLTQDPSRHLILVLDITLNHLDDPDVAQVFETFTPFIQNEQLEFFGIQSLAKLMQLGGDNFSGGGCFYVGSDTTIEFPEPLREKSAFFGLMNTHFRDLTAKYIARVRQNTESMYLALAEKLEKSSAIRVTLNVDDRTVYVAISFAPLLDMIEIQERRDRDQIVRSFVTKILALAEKRSLPITGRQSFGFALSNMNTACDAIRFSIGVEHEPLHTKYADLLEDFCGALSETMDHSGVDTDVDNFFECIDRVQSTLEGKHPISVPVSILEEIPDSNGHEGWELTGKATLGFDRGQLYLDVKGQGRVHQSDIGKDSSHGMISRCSWSQKERFVLCFHLHFYGQQKIEIHKSHGIYAIAGVFAGKLLFFRDKVTSQSQSGVSVMFKPEFRVRLKNGSEYSERSVYVRSEEFSLPVRIDKLDRARKTEIYHLLSINHLHAQEYLEQGTILLLLHKEKGRINYLDLLSQAYISENIRGVINKLEHLLTSEELPLAHDHSWTYRPSHSLDSLQYALRCFGAHIVFHLTDQLAAELENIPETRELRKSVYSGMINGLLDDSLAPENQLEAQPAAAINAFLENKTNLFHQDFEWWTQKLWKYHKEHPDQCERLFPYIDALFPLIKCCVTTSFLIDNPSELSNLRLIGHPGLIEYIVGVEDTILGWEIETHRQIALYFEIYVCYPYPSSGRIVQHVVDASPIEARIDWLEGNFNYAPVPSERFGIGMADIHEDVYSNIHRTKITSFFLGIGCKNLLINSLRKKPAEWISKALRWAFITRDQEICDTLVAVCQTEEHLETFKHAFKENYWFQNCMNDEDFPATLRELFES